MSLYLIFCWVMLLVVLFMLNIILLLIFSEDSSGGSYTKENTNSDEMTKPTSEHESIPSSVKD